MTGCAVLLTGSLASGKTVVAKEIVAIAKQLGLRAAAIDLDWLGWATAAIDLDELIARNLSPVGQQLCSGGVSTASSWLAASSIRTGCRPSPVRFPEGSSW